MKKLLGIVVLGFLWCNVGFAYCYSDCPSPPKFDERSVEKNVFEHGWKPLFNLSSEDENDSTIVIKSVSKFSSTAEKKYMRINDEYFILNSMNLSFIKIDPDTGYSGEWHLRCGTSGSKIH
jgi:hypothetical protein